MKLDYPTSMRVRHYPITYLIHPSSLHYRRDTWASSTIACRDFTSRQSQIFS